MTTTIHHLNCGTLEPPLGGVASCHCLLLEDEHGFALVDTGVGLLDVWDPVQRFGQALIDAVGFRFNEADTAVRQLERLGIQRNALRNIVLAHADCDHAGGLADFPGADVFISSEELTNLQSESARYLPVQFAHGPRWQPMGATSVASGAPEIRRWFGLEARVVPLGFSSDVPLIPLPGHTNGHCGVAVEQDGRWAFHVGDAYYLRVETERDDHPVSQLAAQRADNDERRRASLDQLRRLLRDHHDVIDMFGTHDIAEFAGKRAVV